MLTLLESLHLRQTLNMTPVEVAIVAAVLDGNGRCDRLTMREYAALAGRGNENPRSFDVHLHRTNKKLPATIRIVPEGKAGLATIAYKLSNEWALKELLRLAGVKAPAAERAA